MASTNSERVLAPAGRALPPEHELLLCCARVDPGPAQRERIRELASGDLSWERLEGEAAYHGLIPLLHRNLARYAKDLCPDAFMERCRAAASATLWFNLQLTSELIRLVEVFHREAIALAAIKGPVVAQALYGDVSLRTFSDLDVLIPRDRLAQAREVLESQGYTPCFALRPGWDEVYGRRYNERPFRRDAPAAMLDLHWGLFPPGYSFSRAAEGLWERLEVVALGPAGVPTLGRRDLLVYLCLHAAKHGWSRLKWICDTAEFLRAGPAPDWEPILNWAAERGARRQLHVSLHLAHRLLDAPVPADVLAAGRADRNVAALADRVVSALASRNADERGSPALPWNSFGYQSMERARDRLRLVYEGILAPHVSDWLAVPLPVPLSPVYYGIRPLRLLWKYAPGRRSRPPG